MKKNLILMTALFAGSMIVNDGFGGRGKRHLSYRHHVEISPVVERPNNETQRDVEDQDEELPTGREQLEQEKVRDLQTQLTETRGKLDSTREELESAQKAKEELETKIKGLEESKEKIQAQLSEKENDLKKLTGQNDKFQKLQERLKEQGAALKKAQTQLSTKEEKLKKLQQEQQELRQKYDELETQLERFKQSYSGLEKQVNSITEELKKINSTFEANVLGKIVIQDLQLGTKDDELGRQIAILNAYVHALQGLYTNDGTKKEMSKEEQKSIDKFIEDLHTLNKNVGTYTQYTPQKNDKKGIEGIRFEIEQLSTNIANLLESYKSLSDQLSQIITAQAPVEVKREKTHSADNTQRRSEEFSTQNKKSYWIPGWVKTIGVGVVGVVGGVVLTVLAKQYQNYSVTVPATPGTNSLSTYRINYNATHDVIWNTDTGSMRYLNGTEYKFGELDIDRLNEAYPEPFKQYLNESQTSAESQWTSWFSSWSKTDNKQNKDKLCKNYCEESIKNGTKSMQKELEELKTQNNKLQENNTDLQTELESAKSQYTSCFSELKELQMQNSELKGNNTALQTELETAKIEKTTAEQKAEEAKKNLDKCNTQNSELKGNNTALQTELETSKTEKTTAEQKAEEAKKNLDKCNTKKDQLNDNASFLTQQLGECTNDKTKANKDLKQCNADKAEMYTKKQYDARYNDGIEKGKDEKKCPNTGSTISEEDQEILRRYKEREEKIKKLNEETKASSNFSPKNFKYLWEKIKLRFFYF